MKRLGVAALMAGLGAVAAAGVARADWTPMISSSSFAGITTDAGTAASGIVGVCLIVAGLGVLVRVLTR